MTSPGARTAQAAASDIRQRLDAALKGAGFEVPPAIVTVDRVDGMKVNRISPGPMSLRQAERLCRILEAARS
ncbi:MULTISPECIES: hypothetical protein [Streptomyces]|uniref:hypothetical protein n=1 Tax=Streptomyces TaxID=1883 RepID=UPI0036A6E419